MEGGQGVLWFVEPKTKKGKKGATRIFIATQLAIRLIECISTSIGGVYASSVRNKVPHEYLSGEQGELGTRMSLRSLKQAFSSSLAAH